MDIANDDAYPGDITLHEPSLYNIIYNTLKLSTEAHIIAGLPGVAPASYWLQFLPDDWKNLYDERSSTARIMVESELTDYYDAINSVMAQLLIDYLYEAHGYGDVVLTDTVGTWNRPSIEFYYDEQQASYYQPKQIDKKFWRR
jgi:hypothetical protein